MSEQELEEFASTKRKGKPRARLEIEVALLTGATRLFATIKPRGAIYTQLGLMVQG
jgi:hypothetical protein